MNKLTKILALCAVTLASSQAFAQNAAGVRSCTGTEPFWSLSLSSTQIRFVNQGSGERMTMAKGAPRTAAGSLPQYIALYQGRLLENSSRFMNVIIQAQSCSDGMSDIEYPYQALVLSGSSLYRGCCR